MKKPIPEKIDLTAEEANKLIAHINANCLSEDEKKVVAGVIHFCLWLQVKLSEAKITIRKLSKFFGVRSEKRTKKENNPSSPTEPIMPISDNESLEDTLSNNPDSIDDITGGDSKKKVKIMVGSQQVDIKGS